MFFQNPSRRAFLEGPGADLASKGRFWSHFRFSAEPKIDPWGDMFAQNVDFELPGARAETLLGPTRGQNGRRTLPNPMITDF